MTSSCIHTNYAIGSHGYGVAYVDGAQVLHHRLVYCQNRGLELADIKGQVVRHTCDNRLCVNPEHLVIGSQADNVQDMHERGRASGVRAAGKDHGSVKLTEQQVLDIRSRTRESQRELAAEFGVSQYAIYSIIARKTWKHI